MLLELLSLFLLSLFIIFSVVVLFARTVGSLTGMAWRTVLRLDLPENEKRGWERLYTLIWLAVGLWAFITLWGWSLMRIAGAIFGFLAFRSGANVTRTLVYGLHDRRIIKEQGSGGTVLGVVARATELSLLLETVLVLAFALAYKALSVAIRPGVGVNTFIVYLWLSGLLFGLLFGWFIARNNRGILLRNAIATVGFFTIRKGKSKAGKTVEAVKKAPEKLLPRTSKTRK